MLLGRCGRNSQSLPDPSRYRNTDIAPSALAGGVFSFQESEMNTWSQDWKDIFRFYEVRKEMNGVEIALQPKSHEALPQGVLRFSAIIGIRTIGLDGIS